MEKRLGNTPPRKYWDSTLKPGYDRHLALPNSPLRFLVISSARRRMAVQLTDFHVYDPADAYSVKHWLQCRVRLWNG